MPSALPLVTRLLYRVTLKFLHWLKIYYRKIEEVLHIEVTKLAPTPKHQIISVRVGHGSKFTLLLTSVLDRSRVFEHTARCEHIKGRNY